MSGILLSVLKMAPESFKENLITMNDTLSESTLDQILHYMPTSAELTRLKEEAANTPLDEFHDAEKFALAVSVFGFVFIDLKSYLFLLPFSWVPSRAS